MSKELLAKFGVFALIVVNLGAYFVFWPNATPHAPGENGKAIALEKQDSSGKPASSSPSVGVAPPVEPVKPSLLQGDVTPGVIPPLAPLDKPPSAIPDPLNGGALPIVNELPAIPRPTDPGSLPAPAGTLTPIKAEDPTIALLKKLKESVGKENGSQAVPPPLVLPPTELVGLKPIPATDEKAVYKPLRPDNRPWSVQMETSGGQKVLNARLHKRTDFRIVCDDLDTKTLDGAVVALGKVSFTGPGLKCSCGRLTLNLVNDSLILEGNAEAQIQQGSAADAIVELKGERLTFRLQQPTGDLGPAQPLNVTPATSTPLAIELFPNLIPSQVRPGASPLGGQGNTTGTGK
jgi:hypothetical protein